MYAVLYPDDSQMIEWIKAGILFIVLSVIMIFDNNSHTEKSFVSTFLTCCDVELTGNIGYYGRSNDPEILAWNGLPTWERCVILSTFPARMIDTARRKMMVFNCAIMIHAYVMIVDYAMTGIIANIISATILTAIVAVVRYKTKPHKLFSPSTIDELEDRFVYAIKNNRKFLTDWN